MAYCLQIYLLTLRRIWVTLLWLVHHCWTHFCKVLQLSFYSLCLWNLMKLTSSSGANTSNWWLKLTNYIIFWFLFRFYFISSLKEIAMQAGLALSRTGATRLNVPIFDPINSFVFDLLQSPWMYPCLWCLGTNPHSLSSCDSDSHKIALTVIWGWNFSKHLGVVSSRPYF